MTVMAVHSVPVSAWWWMVGAAVAAMGIGPLASWASTQPAVKRILIATLIACGIGAALIVGQQIVDAHGMFYISCGSWTSWPWCWGFEG